MRFRHSRCGSDPESGRTARPAERIAAAPIRGRSDPDEADRERIDPDGADRERSQLRAEPIIGGRSRVRKARGQVGARAQMPVLVIVTSSRTAPLSLST